MAGRYDLEIEQGATLQRTITYRDADGDLVDLTSYTARAYVRASYDASSTLLEMTTANGRLTLGGAAGTITVLVSATITAALDDWGKGVWDLELVDAGGVVTRLLEGNAVLSKETTR